MKNIRPMIAQFETDKEYEEFINWVHSKQKTDSESFEQMRKDMKEIRKIRSRENDKYEK